MSDLSLESIASKINREYDASLRDAASAVEHARAAGQLLLEAKDRCDHGKWQEWLSVHCENISVRTAERYMRVAKAPKLEAASLREAILKLSAPKKPKTTRVSHLQVVEKQGESSEKPRATVVGEVPLTRAAAVVDLPKPEQLAAAQTKPTKASEDGAEPEDNEEAILELAAKEREASLEKVLAADDRLAAAATEIKRQAAEIASLKTSRDGFMNGKAEYVKLLEKEQRKTARLEKRIAELEKQLGKKAA